MKNYRFLTQSWQVGLSSVSLHWFVPAIIYEEQTQFEYYISTDLKYLVFSR